MSKVIKKGGDEQMKLVSAYWESCLTRNTTPTLKTTQTIHRFWKIVCYESAFESPQNNFWYPNVEARDY